MTFIPEKIPAFTHGPNGGKLKIVVLDCPYDTLHTTITQTLLIKTIAMKVAGYRKHYPYGVLPADTCDFVATHMLLCEEKNNELNPLMGMKFTTLDRCKIHNLEFPLRHIVDRKYNQHYQSVTETLSEIELSNETCAYSSSWTMSEEVRKDKTLSLFCKYLNMAMFSYYSKLFKIKNIVDGATTRFKIEQWKKFLGYEPFKLNGISLGEVPCDPFFGEPILLMRLKNISTDGECFSKQFEYLWDKKLIITGNSLNEENTWEAKIA